jgi:seryl-tRNA(Sec) selenium transferase
MSSKKFLASLPVLVSALGATQAAEAAVVSNNNLAVDAIADVLASEIKATSNYSDKDGGTFSFKMTNSQNNIYIAHGSHVSHASHASHSSSRY